MKHWILILILGLSTISFAQVEYQLAVQQFEDGKIEDATEAFRTLFKKQPTENVYNYLFLCYLSQKEYKEAKKLSKDFVGRNRSRAGYFEIDYGYVRAIEGDSAEANEIFNSSLTDIQTNPSLGPLYSEKFKKYGIFQFAVGALETATESNPNMRLAYNKAKIYADMGDLPKVYSQYIVMLDENPGYMNIIQFMLQNSMNETGEFPQSADLVNKVIRRLQGNPSPIHTELLIWILTQEKNFRMAFTQLRALDKRGQDVGFQTYQLAQYAMNAGDYENAENIFQYTIDKGPNANFYDLSLRGKLEAHARQLYANPNRTREELLKLNVEFINAKSLFRNRSDLQILAKQRAELWFKYLHNNDSASAILEAVIPATTRISPVEGECILLLGDIRLAQDEPYDALLLYARVEKGLEQTDISDEAKFKKATVAYYQGDFPWAKAQFDVLKSSTSKLISNDAISLSLKISENTIQDSAGTKLQKFALAEMYRVQGNFEKSDSLLLQLKGDIRTSELPDSALMDDLLYTMALNAESTKKPENAIQLYGQVYTYFKYEPLADDALWNCARLLEQNNHPSEAKPLYKKLIEHYPNSIFAQDARSRFREMRGDELTQ